MMKNILDDELLLVHTETVHLHHEDELVNFENSSNGFASKNWSSNMSISNYC